MNKITKHPTFFVDIDGTIIKYRKFQDIEKDKAQPIHEVIDFLNNQFDLGSQIIITTARPEQYRNYTINELQEISLKYHQLIMNLGRGTRVILNDNDPDSPHIDRAVGISLERNQGFKNVDLDSIILHYESK